MILRVDRQVGIVFLIVSNGLTATVDAVAKHLSSGVSGVQIAWGYFAAIALYLLVYALARPTPLAETLATSRLALQFTRGAMLVGTISTLFIGLTYLPLADTIAISFATPLIITLLSIPILGEKVGAHRLGAVVVGFAGVVIVIQPGGGVFHWAALMAIASAVFFALFQIITRVLAATENTFTTLFYTGLSGFLWSSLLVGFFWVDLDLVHALVFAGIGLLGVAAHFCMIKAYQFSQASLLAPFNYAKLLWGVVLGYLVFAEVPASHVVLGSTIIVASGLYVVLRERRPA